MLKRITVFRNILVLAALVGMVLLSWLLGHVLRYSFPALWHVPIQETDPRIKVGMELEFEGIRRQVIFPENPSSMSMQNQERAVIPDLPLELPEECQALTYFTSLPAKCLAADGRFVKVGETGSILMLLPPKK